MRFNDYIKHTEIIDESINDIGIFKALFMCGTPGAGKSYVLSKISSGKISPRIVNTDKFVEFFGNGGGVDWKKYGEKVETLNKNQLILYINSLLPLWIDGTSSNPRSLFRRVGVLKSLGYDTGLVWIDTNIDTAIKRAKERKRVVPEEYIRKVYDEIAPLKNYYKNEFKYFKEIKNNDGELTDSAINKAFKSVYDFFTSPIQNALGIDTLNKMKEKKVKYLDELNKDIITKLKKDVEIWYA